MGWDERDEANVSIASLARPHLSAEGGILMVGAGNSHMSAQMFIDGFPNITNIDLSEVAMEQMQTRYPDMTWLAMDARNLTFADGAFQGVVEKGTIDALKSGMGATIPAVLAEIARVLASGGAFVSISHDKHREKLYEEHLPGCTCGQPVYISTGKGAHVYICLKS
jgi:ubiquinone/menaquinone biosynthesis C-methylase UbiE